MGVRRNVDEADPRSPRGGASLIGPSEGSGPFPTGAGLASVLQTSWNTVPGISLSSTTVASGPSEPTTALPFASCAVTTRRIAGKALFPAHRSRRLALIARVEDQGMRRVEFENKKTATAAMTTAVTPRLP